MNAKKLFDEGWERASDPDFRRERAFNRAIAQKVKKILKERNLSQGDLAAMLGVTPARVSQIVTAYGNLSNNTIYGLIRVLDYNFFELAFQTQKVVVNWQFNEIETIENRELVDANDKVIRFDKNKITSSGFLWVGSNEC